MNLMCKIRVLMTLLLVLMMLAVTVATLDQLDLSTLDARIMTSKGHFSIET